MDLGLKVLQLPDFVIHSALYQKNPFQPAAQEILKVWHKKQTVPKQDYHTLITSVKQCQMNDLVTEVRRWVEGRPHNPLPLVYEDEDKGRLWNIHCSHINFLIIYIYRPQRSWAKVMFSQVCVCKQGGEGCLPQCMLGCPLGADTPRNRPRREQTRPTRHPLGADTPQSRHPLWEQTPPMGPDPPEQTPREQTPPPDIPLWEQTPTGRRHPPAADTPPESRLQHTVNEQPARILLECILVLRYV